jgi:hypothetical protein
MNRITRSLIIVSLLTLLVTAGLLGAQTTETEFNCPVPADFWLADGVDWPVNGLQLGVQFYTQAQIIDLLRAATGDDASLIMAFELVAAKLNIANGSDPIAVRNALLAGDRLLADYNIRLPYAIGLDGQAARLMLDNTTVLEFYNSRQLTPICVDANLLAPAATEDIAPPAATPELVAPPVATPEIASPASTPEIAPPAFTPEVSTDDDDSGQGRGRGRGRGGDDDSDDDD